MTSPNRPRDTNQLAKAIVDIAAGEVTEAVAKRVVPGNAIGGQNRARKLSDAERRAIAEKAASVRWRKDRLARETTE